jgi:hypothetical protein
VTNHYLTGQHVMVAKSREEIPEKIMNYEQFNAMLNRIRLATSSSEVEDCVVELHKLTDHGAAEDRVTAEKAIYAARKKCGSLRKSMVGDFEQELTELASNDVATLLHKGRSYGDSWKRRGGVGAFMMLARKWDRIENQAKAKGYDVFEACRDTDMMDDIRDLRCYLLLVEHEMNLLQGKN